MVYDWCSVKVVFKLFEGLSVNRRSAGVEGALDRDTKCLVKKIYEAVLGNLGL